MRNRILAIGLGVFAWVVVPTATAGAKTIPLKGEITQGYRVAVDSAGNVAGLRAEGKRFRFDQYSASNKKLTSRTRSIKRAEFGGVPKYFTGSLQMGALSRGVFLRAVGADRGGFLSAESVNSSGSRITFREFSGTRVLASTLENVGGGVVVFDGVTLSLSPINPDGQFGLTVPIVPPTSLSGVKDIGAVFAIANGDVGVIVQDNAKHLLFMRVSRSGAIRAVSPVAEGDYYLDSADVLFSAASNTAGRVALLVRKGYAVELTFLEVDGRSTVAGRVKTREPWKSSVMIGEDGGAAVVSGGPNKIRVARFSASGAPVFERTIATTGLRDMSYTYGSNGRSQLLGWMTYRKGQRSRTTVRIARVHADGSFTKPRIVATNAAGTDAGAKWASAAALSRTGKSALVWLNGKSFLFGGSMYLP